MVLRNGWDQPLYRPMKRRTRKIMKRPPLKILLMENIITEKLVWRGDWYRKRPKAHLPWLQTILLKILERLGCRGVEDMTTTHNVQVMRFDRDDVLTDGPERHRQLDRRLPPAGTALKSDQALVTFAKIGASAMARCGAHEANVNVTTASPASAASPIRATNRILPSE